MYQTMTGETQNPRSLHAIDSVPLSNPPANMPVSFNENSQLKYCSKEQIKTDV